MNSTEINALLASYGIDPANLSPEVKDGLNEILRTAGRTALESFIKIMEAEARKRGISAGTPGTPGDQNEAAKQAAEQLKAEQEAQAAAKKRRNVIIGISVGVAALIAVVVVIIVQKRKRS